MKAFLTAGLALATCAAFAAITKQDFAGTTAGESPSGAPWYGDGGKYAAKTSGSNDMVLAIEGSMICSNATGAVESEFVKTSFDVKAPEDETTELPTGDELTGCQIAIATGAASGDDLKVMVYAITNANTACWADTGLTVATGGWFNVALSFDYSGSTKTAKVQIGNAVAGPFTLVTPPDSTTAKINSLNFVGSTEIDDVGINEAVVQNDLANDLKGLKVYLSDMDLTSEDLTSGDTYGGLTVAQRLQAGLEPKASTTFTATALATDGEMVGITVPRVYDNGQVYSVLVTEDGVVREDTTPTLVAGDGTLTLKVTPTSNKKVIKLQVKASAPGALN